MDRISNVEETKMTDEAFNELIDNFEVVGYLTKYGRKAIKQKVKKMRARIKELEEENMQKDLEKIGIEENIKADMKEIIERYYTANEECISKQKIKDAVEKIAEYKIARAANKGYYYEYFINQDYKEDFIKLFNELLEDK